MPTKKNYLYPLSLVLLLFAGATLRLLYLKEPSLWWDEFITLGISQLPIRRMLHILTVVGPSDIGGEFFPPLYHLLTHAVLTVSHNDAILRLLSVVSGTGSIAIFYALTRAVLSRRAGLFAAALTTFSVYQLHYSRELRPYSLFMLLALLSLLLLYRVLTKGGFTNILVYILTTTAMCYTSYMATSNIAAEGLFTAYFLLRGLAAREFDRKEALRKGLTLLCAVVVVGLCYLPWIPAYKNVFTLLKTSQSPGIPSDFLLTVLSEFGAYAAAKQGLPWLPLAILGLIGCGVAMRPQYRTGLVLFGIFTLMPVAAFLVAGTKLEISSRYVFNAFYLLMALAGLALAWLLERAAAYLALPPEKAAWSVPLTGLLVCLLISLPNLQSLSIYYRRETSYSKELADYLAWNKNAVRYLFYQSNRNPKLIADWYLPNVFANLSHYTPQGYKRTYHLIQSDLTPPKVPFVPHKCITIQDTTVSGIGLVSTAPVVLFPDANGHAHYVEDFTTYQFYADCDEAVNLGPESRYHTLSHYNYEQPGHVTYRFVAAPGTRLQRARLRLEFSVCLLKGVPSDSRILVSVATNDAPFLLIDTITEKNFLGPDGRLVPENNEKRRFITKTYAMPEVFPNGVQQIRLRLDYGPVANPGIIEAFRLALDADLTGRPIAPDPALAALERAARHNTLAIWQPGVPFLAADALYAFAAAPDVSQGPANPYAALSPFLAAHPGLEPVFSIPGAKGAPAYLFYDPALTDPFVRLSPHTPVTARLGQTPPQDFPVIKLEGALHRPKLQIGGRALSIDVLSPPPSTLLLERNGRGVLRFEPSFATANQALAAFPLANAIKKNDGEDCLSCQGPGPCSVTVPISSAYPIRLLRIQSYPRVFADKAGRNKVTIAFSPDGRQFKTLDVFKSDRSGLWKGLMARRVSVLRFPRPINNGFVRFELSGPGAQLWSRDTTRMRLEAELDASAFTGLTVSDNPVSLELKENGGAPLSLFLSPWSQPYLPGLQDDF